MEQLYQIAENKDTSDLHEFLVREGQALLELSARGVAGPRHQGRAGGEIRRHGRQQEMVA